MSNSKATIEFARPSDVVQIGGLSKRYIEYDLGWHYTPKRLRELLSDKAKNIVVARKGNELAGFGMMTYEDQNANLDLLAVESRYRRCGIGREIVTWLEEVARTAGITNVFVQVRKSNRGAVRFYAKCGFQVIDELGGYYRGTEAGVIMCKSVNRMLGAE